MSEGLEKVETEIPSFEYEDRIRRVFIIGVSSYIGSALAIHLRDHFEVFGTYLRTPTRIEGVTSLQLDCFDGNEILNQNKRYSPDAIIFCAGFNDKARCQIEVAKAEAINFKAPAIFFKLLPSTMRFIYFSTDEVFGPDITKQAPFDDSAAVSPGSVWAKTKFQGESVVTNHKGLTATFRLGRVYGEVMGSPLYAKLNWLNSLSLDLDQGNEVSARRNQVRSYTYIGDVARAVGTYLKKHNRPPVLYNLASKNAVSESEFLKSYAELFGYDPQLIQEVDYSLPKPREGAPEPLNCSLISSGIQRDYGFKPQTVEDGLAEFKNRLHEGWTKRWS